MSLKKDCHSKWIATQNKMSLKMECHSKFHVTQNGMSLEIGMSLKIECHSKWNVIQNEMSLKMESNIIHEDFLPLSFIRSSFVMLRVPPLDSEMGWTRVARTRTRCRRNYIVSLQK